MTIAASRGRALRQTVDGRKRLHLAAVDLIERTVDNGETPRWVEIVRGRGGTRRSWPRLAGRHSQDFARLIDRMGLGSPRFKGWAGEWSIGARRAGVGAGRDRGRERLNRAESVGRDRDGRRSSWIGRGRTAPLRLGGERGDDRAALLQQGLPGHESGEPGVERAAVGRPQRRRLVEPRARFSQAAFIRLRHFRLPRDHGPDQIVVKSEIGGDESGPGEQESRNRRDCP